MSGNLNKLLKCKSIKKVFNTGNNYETFYGADISVLTVVTAGELLKEMAEALASEVFHNRDYWGVETDFKKKPLSETIESERVLKKFMEWK